jgi:Na+/H+-dicarboxylate symporter
MFDIPIEGIADITDRSFCDMFRSATNVLEMHATSVVGKWEENNKLI